MMYVCMQAELPEICHFKNDEQKFMALCHRDMPGQEGSDVRMKNPPHRWPPVTWCCWLETEMTGFTEGHQQTA